MLYLKAITIAITFIVFIIMQITPFSLAKDLTLNGVPHYHVQIKSLMLHLVAMTIAITFIVFTIMQITPFSLTKDLTLIGTL
jgi:FtsH-binding integral membrane protein